MPDETEAAVIVESQLFDGRGNYRLRVSKGEPLWRILEDSLRQAQQLADVNVLERDYVLEGAGLFALTAAISTALRNGISKLQPVPPEGSQDETIEAFGDYYKIRVRDPQHYATLRISRLYGCLAENLKDPSPIVRLYAVPDLSAVDRILVGILKKHESNLDNDQLTDMVGERLLELQASENNPDIIASRQRVIDQLGEALVLQRINRLHEWRLIERSRSGAVRGSDKLRAILY